MTSGPPRIPALTRGTLYGYRIFEVADEVDLEALGRVSLPHQYQLRPGRLTFFGQLRSLFSVVSLGWSDVELEPGRWAQAELSLLVFRFGVVAVCYQFQVGAPEAARSVATSIAPDELARWVRVVNSSSGLTEHARGELTRLEEHLGPARPRIIHWSEFESYSLVSAQEFAEPTTPDKILASPDLVRILLGEDESFVPAPSFHKQATAHHFRYGADDLCVVEWDAAFVLEPRPAEDIPHLLALALTQLLEFQRYDQILEKQLAELYRFTERHQGHWDFHTGRTRRMVDQVNELLLDVSEFVDRTENAIKITEDQYYARVYRGAIDRFQIPAWRSSVERRQRVMGEVAGMLHSQAHLAVSHLLELVIIALITFEIVMAFVR